MLTRLILRAKPLVHEPLAGVRDAFRSRVRSARRVLQQLHRLRRSSTDEEVAEAQRGRYTRVPEITRQTVRQARRVRCLEQVATASGRRQCAGPPTGRARLVPRLLEQLGRFLPLVQRGMQQAQARVLEGRPVTSTAKVLSLFKPHTRVVKRRKLGAPVEFGRQVMLDEVAGGIVTCFHVLADDEFECHQALPAVQHHRVLLGRPPWLVAGNRRLHTKGVKEIAQDLGVTHVVISRTDR